MIPARGPQTKFILKWEKNSMLHTFENYVFEASEIDTPIEDPKLDGRFVERIRGSSRESSIGVVKNGGTPLLSPPWGH